ncbi:hypothetical protein FACS189430_05290 [Bacteroidia bacterium]|nr:hypothetical protein FACS189430_05290 [Bacteroidia bacterium]
MDCEVHQLGEATLFAGNVSRPIALSCDVLSFGGINIFAGDSSRFMMTATACQLMPEPLTPDNIFGGSVSRNAFLACVDAVSLGEPTAGYYRGGVSRSDGVDCYVPPCLDLQPSVISSVNAMPVCTGKTVTLTASPAANRLWQRYDGAAWVNVATGDAYITVAETTDVTLEFRLISYGSGECADTSDIFYLPFITDIPKPTITADGSTTICVDGSLALHSSEAHDYLWSNGATTRTVWIPYSALGSPAADYTVTITDVNGCSAVSDPITLYPSSAVATKPAITPNGTVELCAGSFQTLTADNAASYQWSNGATSQAISVGEAGKYTVRTKDVNGCEATADSVRVIVHQIKPKVQYTTLVVCNGNGIDLSLSPHAAVTWYKTGDPSPTGTTQTVTVTGEGEYYAALDTLSCIFLSDTVTVLSNASSAISAHITASIDVLCEGGDVVLTADEAEAYQWSTGEETQSITVAAAGAYSLSVTDELGCTTSDLINIAQVPVTLVPQIALSGNADLCPATTVTLTASANETHSFLEWSTAENTPSIVAADSGYYSVTMKDAKGCAVTSNAVKITIYPTLIPVVEAGTAVICGSEPLLLSAMVENGYGNLQYRWFTDGTPNGGTDVEYPATAAGNYAVEVASEDGCLFLSAEVSVTAAAAPVKPVISTVAPFAISNDTIWICPNQVGAVSLTSTAAALYEWSDNESTQTAVPDSIGKFAVRVEYATTCAATSDTVVIALRDKDIYVQLVENHDHLCPGETLHLQVVSGDGQQIASGVVWNTAATTPTLEVSAAGEYYAVVTGAGGCVETTEVFEVFAHPAVTPAITPSGNINLCPYESVELTATEGASYLWSTGDTDESIIVNAAGSYSVTVTDIFGCVQTSAAVNITLLPQRSPVINLSAAVICQGETVTITAPADGASWLWSNGETTQTLLFDDPDLTGTRRYQVTVTYSDGCTFASPEASFLVNRAPRELYIAKVGSNQICPDRTLALVATMSEDWTYEWRYEGALMPETFNAIVIDQPGNYTVTNTVKSTGCSNSHTEYFNLSPASAEIHPEGPVSLCTTGFVDLEAFTSEGDVSYVWTTGDTTKIIRVNNIGYYRFTAYTTVIDPATGQSFSCPIQSKPILVTGSPISSIPTVTASGPLTFCKGDKVTLTSSLSSNGKYQWYKDDVSLGDTWRSLEVSESGKYYVTTTDATGCVTASKPITVTANPLPEASINPATDITVCADETVTLSALFGEGYAYQWSPTLETTRVINAGAAGVAYTVRVTAKGCANTSNPLTVRLATLNERAPMPNVAPTGVCIGEKAVVTATSTLPDAEFIWWDAETDGNAIGYNDVYETAALTENLDLWVSVNTEDFCESPRRKVTVTAGERKTISFVTANALQVCANEGVILLEATPAGGTFTGNGVTGDTFNPQLTGTGEQWIYYTALNEGCASTDSITVTVKSVPWIAFGETPETLCMDAPAVAIEVLPEGGILSGKGVTGDSFNPSVAGAGEHYIRYTFVENGCSAKDSVKITVTAPPTPVITNTQTSVSLASGSFVLTATPAGGEFFGTGVALNSGQYYFDPAQALPGSHEITYVIFDSNGCTSTASKIFIVTGGPVVDKPAAPAAVCSGAFLTPVAPAYDLLGATLVSAEWLLDSVAFDPATEPVFYSDHGKILQYKVVSSSGTGISEGVAITVNAPPLVATIAAIQAVCNGSTLSLNEPALTLRGAVVSEAYWMLDAEKLTQQELEARVFTSADAGKTLHYIVETACGNAQSNDGVITIATHLTAPVITMTPAHGVICSDNDGVGVILSTTSIFTDYEWYKDGAKLNGVNGNTLSLDKTQAGTYTLTGYNSGCPSDESNAVSVTVQTLATPTLSGDATACAGTDKVYSLSGISGAASDYHYAWTVSGGVWEVNADSTQATVQWTYGTPAPSINVQLTHKISACTASVSKTGFTVSAIPLIDALAPPAAVCAGSSLILAVPTVTPRGATVTAQGWLLNNVSFNPATPLSYADNGKLLRYFAESACGNDTTVAVPVTVHDKPEIASLQTSYNICDNGKLTLAPSVTVKGAAITNAYWTLNGVNIDLSTKIFTSADNGHILKYVVESACGTVETGDAIIYVHPLPAPVIVGNTTVVCENANETYTISGLTGNASDYTYAWNVSGGNIQGAADQSAVVVHWHYGVPTNLAVTVTNSLAGCEGTDDLNNIIVANQAPVFSVVPFAPLCIGSKIDLTAAVPASAELSYLFYHSDQITTENTPENVTVTGTNAVYYVQATHKTTLCKSLMTPIIVTGKMLPVMDVAPETIEVCHDAVSVEAAFSSMIGNTTYTWTNSKPSIGLAASGNGSSIPPFTAFNTGSPADTALVTVTPVAEGCIGLNDTLTIIVHTKVMLTPTDTLWACTSADLSSAVPANSEVAYTWFGSNQSVVANPSNATVNEGDTALFYVQMQITATGCVSDKTPVAVVGYVLPTVQITNPAMLCEGSSADLTATFTAQPALTYTFYEADKTLLANPAAVTPPVGNNNLYYVRAKDTSTGCDGAFVPIYVSVQAMPTLHIETIGDTAFCYNTSIGLNAVVSNGTPIWTGWWDANGMPDNTAQFAPDPHSANVVYEPFATEAGKDVKLVVRVRDAVCGYLPYDTVYLHILPVASAASIEIITQPKTYQEMCTDTLYEVKIKSVNVGDLDNLRLMLHDYKATGLSIKDAYIKQPYNAATWQALSNFTSATTHSEWNLPQQLESADSLLVRIVVAPECDFFSGADLAFRLNSTTVCGNSLPEVSAYTETFHIMQDTATLNRYEVISDFVSHPANNITNNTSDTVTWRIKAVVRGNKPTDEERETVVFNIPEGLHYVHDSYVRIKNAPELIGDDHTRKDDATYTTNVEYIVNEFGVEYGLHLPPGLTEANKDTIIFEMQFYTQKGYCAQYEFYTEVIFTDSVDCNGVKCTYHITRGGAYPILDIERYRFSFGESVSETIDNLWYGKLDVKLETTSFAGDSLYIDFFIDHNNNSHVDAGDVLTRSFTKITAGLPSQFVLPMAFDSVHFEPEKQLIGRLYGPSVCDTFSITFASLTGADTLCQLDTALYYTTAGQHIYKWNVDVLSGAPPVRIPLDGSTEDNYVNENVARMVWTKSGNFRVWTQYTLDDGSKEVDKSYFPVHVAQRPVLEFTNAMDTVICQGMPVELTHLFSETTGINVVMNYFRQDVDGHLTPLPAQSPLIVYPTEDGGYKAVATSVESGCIDSLVFYTMVTEKPVIDDLTVLDQPNCSVATGAIALTMSGGSGNYEYSLNDTSAYVSLPPYGVIENLPVGKYRLHVRNAQGGCPVAMSDTVDIHIVPEATGIAFELVTQPRAYQEFCADTVYQVKVKALNEGDLSNIRLTMHDYNANGLTIKEASMKQPYDATDWTPLTATTATLTHTIWEMPYILSGADSLLLQIKVAAECDFYSATDLALYLDATTLCDTPLPTDTLYTEPYHIMQDTVTMNSYEIISQFNHNTLNSSTGDTVIWRLTGVVHGTRPTNNVRESMVALVPAGMTAIPGSYKAVKNAPPFDSDKLEIFNDSFGVEYGFRVPGGLVDGDSIIVELKFEATGAPCGEYHFYSEIIYTDSAYCGATKCAYNVTRGGAYPTLTVERYTLHVDTVIGSTLNNRWSGDVRFQTETAMYAGDVILVDFVVDRNNNGLVDGNDTIVQSSQRLTSDVTALDFFTLSYNDVYVEPNTQLLAVFVSDSFCDAMIVQPIAVILCIPATKPGPIYRLPNNY